jgi:hypothetical protein
METLTRGFHSTQPALAIRNESAGNHNHSITEFCENAVPKPPNPARLHNPLAPHPHFQPMPIDSNIIRPS